MKDKILEIYKSGYSSSPIKVSEKEIRLLISHKCSCAATPVLILIKK
jgi:hypothetical protein